MRNLSFTADPAERYLCNAIRHIDRVDVAALEQGYEHLGDEAIYAAAEINGVVPIVGHALLTHLADRDGLPAHWRAWFESTDARIAAYMHELDRVASALSARSIPLIALKNSGITKRLYQHPGASPMGDIDVLIAPRDFHAAHAVMEDLGYTLKFRNIHEKDDIDEAFAGGGAEYSTKLPGGEHLWFELQWRPIAGRWIRPEQEPKAEDLLARASRAPDTDVLLMSPEDNLLQVCLHTAKHSFVRAPGFRLHTDVERIVETQAIDWEAFTRRVRKMHVGTAVYFSLAMAVSLLGSNVPQNALEAIRPARWKIRVIEAWLDRVGVFNPDERKWSNPGFILFVALLYDRPRDLFSGVFPPMSEMQTRYEGVTRANLPLFHLRRLVSLVLKRTGI
jgi:hypothetical protein